MAFKKGNKESKGRGGARPGAGRPDGKAKKALKELLQEAKIGQLAEWLSNPTLARPDTKDMTIRDKAISTVIDAMSARDELGCVNSTALKAASTVLNFTDAFCKEHVVHEGAGTDTMLIQGGQVKRYHKDAPIDEM